jgi:hypothetical protein
MNGAALTNEAAAEILEDRSHGLQCTGETLNVLAIVGGVHVVFFEWNRVNDLHGCAPELHFDFECAKCGQELGIEICDGARIELDLLCTAIAASKDKDVLMEIEKGLQRSPAMLPIPGTARRTHLEENIGAAGLRLTQGEFERLQ